MARRAAGALATDPRLQGDKPRAARGPAPGAMGVDPSGKKSGFSAAGNIEGVNSQISYFENILNKKGGNAPKAQKRLEDLYAARTKLGGGEVSIPSGEVGQPANFESVTGQSNEALSNTFEQIQNQGMFNPGDYTAMRERAEQSVMNSFNNRMNPQFQQQQDQFRQQMAEQGISEGSEGYNRQYQQLQQSQNDARQQAMGQAFQLGQGEQQQGWNQAFQGYQLPLAQLNAMSPYYNVQGQMGMQENQQNWQGEQSEADRELSKWQTKYGRGTAWGAPRGGGGGGGGGLSFEQEMQLQQQGFFNNLVGGALANGNQAPGGANIGNSFAQGLAGGAMIGSGLK